MSDLLLEIGAEEIPAGYIAPALESLRAQVREALCEARLPAEDVRTTGTPRRLTLVATGIPAKQPPASEQVIGPPARAAFAQDGSPTKAAEGFCRSLGVSVESLETVENPEGKKKGTYVAAVVEHAGEAAADVLPGLLAEAARGVTFPKSMRWPLPAGAQEVRFARPIRWLVALLDSGVLPLTIAGVEAGRTTYGHPFFAPEGIELADAGFDAYRDALRAARVLVDVDERREAIRAQVAEKVAAHGSDRMDADLLDEVTNLVESPHAVEGGFDEAFLTVPNCVIVAAMTEHQRYFPVWDGDGKLLPRFITVSNRGPEQEATVREGNERVLRARLADGGFFWEEDRARSLAARIEGLADVTYLGGLGNNLQRVSRLEELAGRIATMMGLGEEDVAHVRRAARLCKADLLTGLVGEFPSLQGVIGRELALEHGEPAAVADAVADHYRPAGADDAPPTAPVSVALALADRLDVMAGCFALDMAPTGSQDPYGLRRSALGVLVTLNENGLELSLGELIGAAAAALEAQAPEISDKDLGVPVDRIMGFFRDRLLHAAVDRGFDHDLVRAALSTGFSDAPCVERLAGNVPAFWQRLDALAACAQQDWWPGLTELVDRTFRIQKDLEGDPGVRTDLLADKAEQELARLVQAEREEIEKLFDQGYYVEGAEFYARRFAEPVHEFFEQVFVNVDDAALRANRKGLCAEVYRLLARRFADLCAGGPARE